MEKITSPIPIVYSNAEDETKAEKMEILDGQPNKKIMKLSELTNMDPLEYFSRFLGIPEMIFKHLRGKDLITASEISPIYYNFIASSKALMKKIKLLFDRDIDFNEKDLVRIPNKTFSSYHNFITSSTDLMETKIVYRDKSATQSEDFNLLKNSSRLYQDIEVRRIAGQICSGNEKRLIGDYVTDSELDLFYSKAHEWKNVSLKNVYFRKKLDLWRLLSAIESSVESIFGDDFGVLSFENPSSEIESFEALKFPNLKQLMICVLENSFSETLVRFLLNSGSIEDLYFVDYTGEFDKDILTKMLTNFDKVKRLTITLRKPDQIFRDESWKKFQFKVTSLTIVFSNLGPHDHVTNFLNFLKSQSEHLEELMITLSFVDKETIFDMIMTMPRLRIFELFFNEAFSENEVPNKISTSITELTLFYRVSAVNLKYLLDSMPNVTKLALQSIGEEHFKMLKSMKRKFKNLRVCELKGVDIKELEEIMSENYILPKTVKLDDLLKYH